MIGFNELGRKGNLGNQLFQFAGLRGIAAHRNFDWRIPDPDDGWIHGKLLLEIFELTSVTKANFGRVPHPTFFSPGKRQGKNSTGFAFDSFLKENVPDNVNLNAFFQSEKYFDNIADILRQDLLIRQTYLDEVQSRFPQAKEDFISVHIRRGDYLKYPKHHPVQTIDYYAAALEHLPRELVLITTDDPSWAAAQKLFQGKRFRIVETGSSALDFTLQTLANYSIISNSTFSWWGAWLANNKAVVAPKDWFGPKLKRNLTDDLIPSTWVKL